MKIRSIITGSLCTAVLLMAGASPAQAQRPPEPTPDVPSSSWTLTIERLLREGQVSSLAERRLIHAELILVLRDGI